MNDSILEFVDKVPSSVIRVLICKVKGKSSNSFGNGY